MHIADWWDTAPSGVELADLVRDYGSLARSLSEACSIPPKYFHALCETLDLASDAFWWANQRQAHGSSLVERRKDAHAFACAAQEMRSRWERLDGHVRAVVARESASATGYALQSDGTIRIGTKTIRISTQPRVRFVDMMTAIAMAGAVALKLGQPPKNRPNKTYPLKQLGFVLFEFWTQTLQRRFTEKFPTDYPDPDDPNVAEPTPENDASRFVYLAIRGLVQPEPDGGTCRYVMRQIIKEKQQYKTKRAKRRTRTRGPKARSSR